MHTVVCPHCKAHRIVTPRPPKDVVVVMPCPACHELVVLFRNKVIALNRRIIERGSMEERKNHLADIIGEFLDAGAFAPDSEGAIAEFGVMGGQQGPPRRASEENGGSTSTPITDEEWERFLKIDLKCIDNAAYFKRHFG